EEDRRLVGPGAPLLAVGYLSATNHHPPAGGRPTIGDLNGPAFHAEGERIQRTLPPRRWYLLGEEHLAGGIGVGNRPAQSKCRHDREHRDEHCDDSFELRRDREAALRGLAPPGFDEKFGAFRTAWHRQAREWLQHTRPRYGLRHLRSRTWPPGRRPASVPWRAVSR